MSLTRIQKYLLSAEINPSLVQDGKHPYSKHVDEKHVIEVNDANLSWSPQSKRASDLITLKNINIKILKGDFVCVIGDVGSGKSSFISALLGDLLLMPKKE